MAMPRFDPNDWKERLEQNLSHMGVSVNELFTGPFKWTELTTFLRAGITLAEDAFPEDGNGQAKSLLVMALWDYYDKKYNLVQRIDDLVDFRKFLGTMIGTVIEQFDSAAIRGIIERIIIPTMVGLIFPNPSK